VIAPDNAVLRSSYNYVEVAVSLLIAISGSYVALFLAERVNAARTWLLRWSWLCGGAVFVGIGIWSMHFTGMQAFNLPVPVAYYWPTVLGSLAVAAAAAALALFLVSRTTMSRERALGGGLCMGGGIAGLHYMDMGAMRMAADASYHPGMVGLSVTLAIIFSLAALWLGFYFREPRPGVAWHKAGAALALGTAISAMHYTGMASATFTASHTQPDLTRTVTVSSLAFAGVAMVTMLLLGLAMACSLVDRRFDAQALELASAEAKLKLSRSNRIATMGELTASIAHEINQPLGAIVTYSSASLRWLTTQPPNLDEARNAMMRSIREANRASEVITRIRALLKNSSPQKTWFNVNEAIREVLALTRQELAKLGVSLQTELAPNIPPVLGDRVQLQQVMLNLVMNAIEAMSNTCQDRHLYIRSESNSNGVHVRIEDTGGGLPSSDVDRIFEPFFTTKREGMGMGLYISRSIIDAHGGRLWATPATGGAVFEFTLPTDIMHEQAS
jgi:NO-binding membrane sensor protein with MHYT domain